MRRGHEGGAVVAGVAVIAASLSLAMYLTRPLAFAAQGSRHAGTHRNVAKDPPSASVSASPSASASGSASGSVSATTPPSPSQGPTAVAFGGAAAVGALFITTKGKMSHICTASMVASPRGNLAITAAHCLERGHVGPTGNVLFAPGYRNGKFPHGLWAVVAKVVDNAWQHHHDADDDVAFLIVGRDGRRVQRYTGAETLQTSVKLPQTVQVTGYPSSMSLPVRCTAPAREVHIASDPQLVFDCGGFTDGTSGGPFLTHVNRRTGTGDLIGVIGGYQQGGDLPDVSYSSVFLRNVAALYKKAISSDKG